ncbi:MAG: ComEC/Rec2 family competence protein, partial [candidate division NC10 bacterium]|nr:ComEC/Rec2 family competence protein [candidate division NC10 bacterium]
MKKPIIGVTITYALGIACASQIPIPLPTPSLLLLLLILLLLAGLILWLHFKARLLAGLILLAFFLLGILSYQLHSHPPSPAHLANLSEELLGRPLLMEGRICTPPEGWIGEEKAKKIRLVLDQIVLFRAKDALSYPGRIRILLQGRTEDFRYGERIRLTAELHRPQGYLNPGGFCLRRYLLSQGIYLEGRARAEEELFHLGRLQEPTFLSLLYDLRSRMLDPMRAQIAAPYHPILQAITLGERSSLDRKTEDAFIGSGTYHVLAISGLNVSMVAAFLYLLLRILRAPLRLRAGLTILWVIVYAVLAGGSSSVVRAAIMSSLFLGALLLEREVDLWNTLALSALLILLWNPLHLLEAGFQLTFGATLGILILMGQFSGSSLPRPLRWLL